MIINELEGKVKGKGIRIVFTEGWDPRVQRAVIDLQANDVVHPILLGSQEQIQKCSEEMDWMFLTSNKSIH